MASNPPERTVGSILKVYFGSGQPATADDVERSLWNDATNADSFDGPGEKYQAAILEQYRIYVEMADRVSARRALANAFFLSVNAAVLTVVGLFWKDRPSGPVLLLALPLVVVVGLCAAWYWLVRSYRQLNSGKFAVIGALERRLPASPYWAAEWSALGEGKDKLRYWPLTHLEQWVPFMFAAAYVAGFIAAIVS